MELRRETTERRRKKIVHRNAELVRSVKPRENDSPAPKEPQTAPVNPWKMHPAA